MVIKQLDKPCYVIQSFVKNDKIYCIHITEGEAVIREHARFGSFLVNTVAEMKVIADPLAGNPL